MSEDRIVYVCGCPAKEYNGIRGFHPSANRGVVCPRCSHPVQAINIDALIRERDRLRKSNHALSTRAQKAETRADQAESVLRDIDWIGMAGWKAERDQIISERDDLRRRLEAMDAAYGQARIELVKARLDNAEGIVYRAFRAALDRKGGG